jgi:hypothetical protein
MNKWRRKMSGKNGDPLASAILGAMDVVEGAARAVFETPTPSLAEREVVALEQIAENGKKH